MFLHQQVAHFELTFPFAGLTKLSFFTIFLRSLHIYALRVLALCSDTVKALDLSQLSAEDNVAATSLWSLNVRSFRLHSNHDKMIMVVLAFRMEAFYWTNRPTQHS
mgnify:CR=1 FL=1